MIRQKTIIDNAKTNVRLSKNMKERFVEYSEGIELTTVSRKLILSFIEEYNTVDIQYIFLDMLRYKTFRKVQYDDTNKDETDKAYMLTIKLERAELNKFKSICDILGLSVAECMRRLINRAIENKNNN